MKPFVTLGSCVLALIPAVALAQQPAACARVEFSQEVLSRFPNIRSACLDVITKGDQQYAVVKADLVRATSSRMTVRVRMPDGSKSDPIGINVNPKERIIVNGEKTRIQDVAIGQELTAYFSVKDPGIALEPAEGIEDVEFTPLPATPEPEPAAVAANTEMPKTATILPLLGTIGFVLIALGAGLAWLRRRVTA